jgi:hypothetical protein
MNKLLATGVACGLLTLTPPFLKESLTNPTPPTFESEVVALTSSEASSRPVQMVGYHDRQGLWHWDDDTIEPNYDWDNGYY